MVAKEQFVCSKDICGLRPWLKRGAKICSIKKTWSQHALLSQTKVVVVVLLAMYTCGYDSAIWYLFFFFLKIVLIRDGKLSGQENYAGCQGYN